MGTPNLVAMEGGRLAAPTAETAPFRAALRRSLAVLAVAAPLVALCYFFIDRPAAWYSHDHDLRRFFVLRWLTEISSGLDALAAAVVVAACVRRARGPLTRPQRTLLAAALSLIVAVALEYYFKFLFGRYWPDTWVQDNPSLIRDGAYGFHPFHLGPTYGSFPSGHTARAVAALLVIGSAYRAWWLPCALVCLAVAVGLVGMNYHFVGDTVGGAALGAVTATFAGCFFGLTASSADPSPQAYSSNRAGLL